MNRSSKSSSKSQKLQPPEQGVAIRMYRQGLGDCFLIAFAAKSQSRPVYVLIDCGVHLGQKHGRKNIAKIFADIVDCTDGVLDVVIATHEHTDHLSAFKQCADYLLDGRLAIKQLWLAWTEREDDPLAESLRKDHAATQAAIQAALEKLRQDHQQQPHNSALSRHIATALQSSLGVEDDSEQEWIDSIYGRLGLRSDRKVTGNQLALALLRETADEVRYFDPGGNPVSIPNASNARGYVLGPPRDPKLLKKSAPSRGDPHETFLTSAIGLTSFETAARAEWASPSDRDRFELCYPFDSRFRIELDSIIDSPQYREFFETYYFNDDSRRIDTDWLYAAETLALHLERHTNNTSLALAFEIGEPGRGRVLLFAADAQVGSWLSWKQQRWIAGSQQVDIENLLSRTALYKVGHHASHNATLARDEVGSPYGLQLMPDGLVTLIPVDQTAAGKLPGWDMPYDKLYAYLKRKSGTKILRADDVDTTLPVPRIKWRDLPGSTDSRWRRSRKTKHGGGALYYDIAFSS